MIVKLIGFIDSLNDDSINLNVSGIVYKIFTTLECVQSISKEKTEITILIHEIYKEDSKLLFGFSNQEEKLIFEELIKVQGVGGKMAINILSTLNRKKIIDSIENNKTIFFTQVNGIGVKLAQRLINELKGKLDKLNLNFDNLKIDNKFDEKTFSDLRSVLTNLGYQTKISEQVTEKILNENKSKKLEDLVPLALKYIKLSTINN